jgi:hypothetical protein
MAKDDDLLPDDKQAEGAMPEENAGGMAPSAEPPAPALPPSPVTAELTAKPRSNVWTLMILITMAAMFAGMYVQLREVNEIFKVNIPVIGQKEGETVVPQPETTSAGEIDTGTDTAAPPAQTEKTEEKTEKAPEPAPK